MRFKDIAMWIYKMAAGYNRKWRHSFRRPRKPHPNMMGIGWRVAELWPFEIFQYVWMGPEVGRWSVVNIHTSYTDLIYSSFGTLGMYTIACEE